MAEHQQSSEDLNKEDPSEEAMDIEDIEAEPIDSVRINRCGHCRRVQFGHPVPYGQDTCQLDRIDDDEELAKDDKVKLELRKHQRGKKRKGSTEHGDSKKQNKQEDRDIQKLVEEGEKMKQLLDKQKEERRKAEESKAKEEKERQNKLKEMAEKNNKIRMELDKEQKKTAELLGGAKRRNTSRERRSRSKKRSPRRSHEKRRRSSRRSRSKGGRRSPSHYSSRRMDGKKEDSYRRLDSPRRFDKHGSGRQERESSRRMESNRNDYGQRNGSRRMDSPKRYARGNRESSRRVESPKMHDSRMEKSRRDIRNNRDYSRRMESTDRERSRNESSRRMEADIRESSHHSNVSQVTAIQEMTQGLVQAVQRAGDDHERKLDSPSTWDKGVSIESWSRRVHIWAEAKAKPERKIQALVEMLKKEKREGVKEMILAEVVENSDFNYKDEDGISKILNKIKDLVDESRWCKVSSLVEEFKNFKQKEGEGNQVYVSRFSTLETKMKNEKVGMSNVWLAATLMKSSKLTKMERNNVLATTNVEDDENVLKTIKRKIRDIDATSTNNEPTNTFYGENDYRRENRSSSRGRSGFNRSGFNRSGSRGNDNFKKGWKDFKNRSGSRDKFRDNRRSGSRGKPRENDGHFQKDGKSPKLTYQCVTLKMDRNRSIFENEVENKALIDSGCPEMVAGKGWIRTFESSEGTTFQTIDKENSFKFGNEVFPTIEYKLVPIRIGNLEEIVEVGIIDSAVPLLISKTKLTEWGAKLDFKDNTLYLEKTDQKVELQETKSGHLVVKLGKNIKEDTEEAVKEVLLLKKEQEYNIKNLKRIHRVFGHPGADKLDSLMKDAGQADATISRILHKIQDSCRICRKYKKKKPKPKVGLPKAREVNEVVSVDLKPVESITKKSDDRQIVYMVDEFSRFTAAGISKNKEAENVMKIILDKWCETGIGHPSKAFFADNGNEFKGRHLEEVCKRLNIKMKLTPSYSAWSNGACADMVPLTLLSRSSWKMKMT